jgi:hypothetical protein
MQMATTPACPPIQSAEECYNIVYNTFRMNGDFPLGASASAGDIGENAPRTDQNALRTRPQFSDPHRGVTGA